MGRDEGSRKKSFLCYFKEFGVFLKVMENIRNVRGWEVINFICVLEGLFWDEFGGT